MINHWTLPLVAIVGRSNVGKSTLFNKIAEQRHALVAKMAGTTRDRVSETVSWRGCGFTLVDTGGLDLEKSDPYRQAIASQSEQAVKSADIILLVADVRVGVLPNDRELVKKLRQAGKPILLTVNKCDSSRWRQEAGKFCALGLTFFPVSALNGAGVGDLLDEIVGRLPKAKGKTPRADITLAIVGKPNVGKSSLLNVLCGEERMIVSPLPHTTRDAQAVLIEHPSVIPAIKPALAKAGAGIHNKIFRVIDTAGIRRSERKAEPIEHLCLAKARLAINAADVVALVIDVSEEPTSQDKRLAQEIIESGKAVVLVANKWDLIKEKTPQTINQHQQRLDRLFPHLSFAPIVFTSAVISPPARGGEPPLPPLGKGGTRGGGSGVKKILTLADEVYQNYARTINDDDLKKFLAKAATKRKPTIGKGTRRPTLLSLKQISSRPPHFLVTIPTKTWLAENYKQYLVNFLRDEFGLEGVPIKLSVKEAG